MIFQGIFDPINTGLRNARSINLHCASDAPPGTVVAGSVRRAIPVNELVELILELEEILKGRPAKPSERH